MRLQELFYQQFRQAEAEASRVQEAMIGVVTDNKDPEKLGRVKVKLPVLSEADATWWAPLVMPGAGQKRGWYFIPEIDDEVLVMFEHGDFNSPIVIGALWNGKDKPADQNDNGNPRRVIKSRAGSRIVFDDEKNCIIIEDGGGVGCITIDANGNSITIEAKSGDVCLGAPSGQVALVADTIQIEAGQNVEIVAGAAMKLTGGSEVKGKGGAVTVAGAMVNINGSAAAASAPSASPAEIPDPFGS